MLQTGFFGLIDQVQAFVNDGTLFDCRALGYNLGLIVSESLEAKTETFVQFIEVQKSQ